VFSPSLGEKPMDTSREVNKIILPKKIFADLTNLIILINIEKMEKRTPHYKLSEVQAVVADLKSRPFTITALRGGLELGLTEPEMRKVVMELGRRNFYKAMTTYSDHQIWQDVYHGVTEDEIEVYIKITGFTDGRPPVIQFKKK
jgi:motility quorum-sensing regulator / GCU-specific mRNA interferase toxin